MKQARLDKRTYKPPNLDDLKAMLDPMIEKKDRFYAVRLDGDFSAIKVRSVPKQEKP